MDGWIAGLVADGKDVMGWHGMGKGLMVRSGEGTYSTGAGM